MSWLRLLLNGEETYSGGAGSYTLAIELDPNYTGSDRSATITVTCAGTTITVTVTQNGKTANGEVPEEPVAVTGVLINGVVWAECNVDAPGTFAATPGSTGMFYQWNRKKGWPATGAVNWDNSNASGDTWEAVNDPSPNGWRLPTVADFAQLLDEEKVTQTWEAQNGVRGVKFTDKSNGNAVFFPAAGNRAADHTDIIGGTLELVGIRGGYWSTIPIWDNEYGEIWYLSLGSRWQYDADRIDIADSGERCNGYTLRCVRVATTSAADTADVVINGVTWAARNVDAPGTFAATPESAGMFYQWNRKKGWPSTGYSVTGWDDSNEPGDTWAAVNDPSPAGYRVPDSADFAKLVDEEKVTQTRTVRNGMFGMKFTDKTSGKAIFLPAAGYRGGYDGSLSDYYDEDHYNNWSRGYYWSSFSDRPDYAWSLRFDDDSYKGNVGIDYSDDWYDRSYGYSLRPVRK